MTPEEIIQLYERHGAAQYGGEDVSQLEHALQCAQLAAQAGADPALVVACLLHDIGHLVDPTPPHEEAAADCLRAIYPPAVIDPIRLHVDAKRYLCRTEPGYWDSLSLASRRSLEVQGGPFDAPAARRFIAQSYARDAVQLRRFDEQAKVAGLRTKPLAHYAALLSGLRKSDPLPSYATGFHL